MLSWLTAKWDPRRPRADALHAAMVAEARAPHLYAGLRVPDTLDGRLEMLTLHLAILLDRLARAGDDGQVLARSVSEAYVIAMDDTMRAIGVGDVTVPRKVKKAAAALYDRHRTYAPAIAASREGHDAPARWHDTLTVVLQEVAGSTPIDLPALAHYADARVTALAAMSDASLLAGRLG